AHDIGGAIGLRFAIARPERVRRLMIMDAVSYDSWPSPTWQKIIDEQLDEAAAMSQDDFDALLTRQLTMAVADPSRMTGEVLRAYLEPHRSPLGRASFFEHQVRHYDSRYTQEISDRFDRLTMPVRIVWGEEDQWQPLHYAKRLSGDIPGAQLVVVPGAGHFLMEDDPDRVVREIRDFLSVPAAQGRATRAAGRPPKCRSAPLGEVDAELTQETEVVVLDPFLGQPAVLVVAEEVDQFESHRLPRRRDRAERGRLEGRGETPRHTGARTDVLTLADNGAPLACESLECGTHGREEGTELRVRHVAVGTVENEVVREVGVQFLVVSHGDRLPADPHQGAGPLVVTMVIRGYELAHEKSPFRDVGMVAAFHGRP